MINANTLCDGRNLCRIFCLSFYRTRRPSKIVVGEFLDSFFGFLGFAFDFVDIALWLQKMSKF